MVFLSQKYSSLNWVISIFFFKILRKEVNPPSSGQMLVFICPFSFLWHSPAFLSEKLNGVRFRLPLLTIFNQLRSIYNVLCTVISTQETNPERKDMTLVNDTVIEIVLGRARFIHKKLLLCNNFLISLHLFHSFNHSYMKNLLKHTICQKCGMFRSHNK